MPLPRNRLAAHDPEAPKAGAGVLVLRQRLRAASAAIRITPDEHQGHSIAARVQMARSGRPAGHGRRLSPRSRARLLRLHGVSGSVPTTLSHVANALHTLWAGGIPVPVTLRHGRSEPRYHRGTQALCQQLWPGVRRAAPRPGRAHRSEQALPHLVSLSEAGAKTAVTSRPQQPSLHLRSRRRARLLAHSEKTSQQVARAPRPPADNQLTARPPRCASSPLSSGAPAAHDERPPPVRRRRAARLSRGFCSPWTAPASRSV